METCRAIRQLDNDPEHSLPVLIVASELDQARGVSAGVTDWLIKPFTGAYARTKVRAWVLRTAFEGMRRALPRAKNLASLRRLAYRTTEAQAAGKGVATPNASQGNRSQAILGQRDQYGEGGPALDVLQRGGPV